MHFTPFCRINSYLYTFYFVILIGMRYLLTLLAAFTVCTASYGQSPFSKVVIPSVPTFLEFAGERVPLDNFDTRESLQRELLVTSYMHSSTLRALLHTKRYFAIIEPILEANGVPNDFKYLAMAESALNPNAMSAAKAAGLWQIMPGTGRDHGLLVGSEVDERYDVEKSTEAACKHLLKSYAEFGSWALAAAAYNLGDAGVRRRIDKQGVTNYYDAFLPEETLRYMFRILSFKLIVENPSFYGYMIQSGDYYPVLDNYTEITVDDAQIDWSKVAKDNGTTYKMLRQLNHWIRDYEYKNTARRKLTVKIPGPGFRSGTAEAIITEESYE